MDEANCIQLGNAKTKEQINGELSELIGEDFNASFTDWLFEQVEQLSYGASQSNGHEDHVMDDSEDSRAHEQVRELPPRHSLKSAPSTARSGAAPYPTPSRVVDQINRTLERSSVPVKHTIPDIPNVPTGPRAQQSHAGPIRRGGRARSGMGMQPTPPDFGHLLSSNGIPSEMFQQMMMAFATAQGFPSLADRISDGPADGSLGIVVAAGDRNRCRHWPRCQLTSRCKFHHPSEICPYGPSVCNTNVRDYPNCKNIAGTCPNIHVGEDIAEGDLETVVTQQLGLPLPRPVFNNRAPRPPKPAPKSENQHPRRQMQQLPKQKQKGLEEQVPLCKFGAMCTNPHCAFAHPTPAAGQDGLVLRGEMCPDGRDCLNKDVPSFHYSC
jgi:nuclear polyadenylated RNA-binding protein NAB2